MPAQRDAQGRFIAGSGSAAKGFRFEPNPHGIHKVGTGPGVIALVNRNAGYVLESARATPDADAEYLRSLGKTPAAVDRDGTVAASVYSDSPFWHLFEFGSINNAPIRPLSRAVTDTGLRFEE